MIAALNSGITFDYINNSVASVVQSREVDLKGQISKLGANPSTTDLLNLQQQIQQWTMVTQIQSTLVKEISDAMKGVIQKAG
jgi:type III secretion protein F